jgi:histidinol phosphatase-like PHP family hydrolase
MPLLKGALHAHTTLSDGKMTPDQVVECYRRLGFDFVAITDHDYLLRPDYRERLPLNHTGILVLAGVELTVFERGYVHVNRIYGDKETLHIFNHPAEYDFKFDDLLQVLTAVAAKHPIDAVEISSKGFYTSEFDDSRIPYPKVASDDSHTELGCGRGWVEVDCALDRDEIIRAVKSGKAAARFR